VSEIGSQLSQGSADARRKGWVGVGATGIDGCKGCNRTWRGRTACHGEKLQVDNAGSVSFWPHRREASEPVKALDLPPVVTILLGAGNGSRRSSTQSDHPTEGLGIKISTRRLITPALLPVCPRPRRTRRDGDTPFATRASATA
jgi:hypothetical protein